MKIHSEFRTRLLTSKYVHQITLPLIVSVSEHMSRVISGETQGA